MLKKKNNSRSKNIFPRVLMVALLSIILFVFFLQRDNLAAIPSFSNNNQQTAFAQEANQQIQTENADLKLARLILQTDERWQEVAYGSGESENNLAKNGCGIASLAMVLSYWEKREVLPTEILGWAQNDYYVENEGTAWQIFEDFAIQYGLNFYNLENDLYAAQAYLSQGIPVIVSVQSGTFTDGGHIMVLRNWDETGIYVNDPNDTAEKSHYLQGYDAEVFLQDGVNYWVYQK
ncbi:ABC-type bacteriocin/lantibiotic exporter with double-glycine peptidase domain [Enterococcus sp. PF1-24]|uniref:C39 family peptidase n=1 Tax=unclassified Enterococcus TaxID=2608891 RepID=UPI00247368E7|nr:MULTISPECIES: C39 family peptidase [unclassified Enterococcus]MDH6364720.1 ABC-type bacteriocin/lantibiotic exporter with double-glycine peptidase domain [Enterococcus sp. PFB1-1]MDH6401804.1 ABC-type bacteriocin/lantibiotic exporter with double-glycine peptidase domain [Enterococcus sp. PF1-24]